MLGVERWAELRREQFVRGVAIKELVRRTGLSRNTIRAALRSDRPPAFAVPERPSKLKDEIHRLLKADPKLSGARVREEIESLGFDGGKSIVDDYVREIRPIFLKLRTHQRTAYRPGEVCQWDLWETSAPMPVGHGQVRRAWVVVCCLGYSRAGTGALIFSTEAPDVVGKAEPVGRGPNAAAPARRASRAKAGSLCSRSAALGEGVEGYSVSRFRRFGGRGGVAAARTTPHSPESVVRDRSGRGDTHPGNRPQAQLAGNGWYFCEPADPQANARSIGVYPALGRRDVSRAGGRSLRCREFEPRAT